MQTFIKMTMRNASN